MDLIAAIATAQGRAGVAVVRLSGEGALALARAMFSHKGEYEPNMMYYGKIDCGTFSDCGLCVYFRAPKSFTGEDTVEFHCHGGPEIARGVLLRAISLGARPAERGEFTRRAYLNGKLSLSAAEGLGAMIEAESLAQVRAGYELYAENLTREGKRLQALLTECLAGADAVMDFPEEDLEEETGEETASRLETVQSGLETLLSRYRTGRKIRYGVRVAICGQPNAGKSSLLNALLGYERAIVSDEAGTTRDTVEGELEYRGMFFRIVDTAGLRRGETYAEQEGVRRAERAMQEADVIIWLKEGAMPSFPQGTPVIVVGAKSDLGEKEGCDVLLSSKTGEGLEQLKEWMYVKGAGGDTDGLFLLEERQRAAVSDALAAVRRALAAVKEGLPADLYAQDIGDARMTLGLLSGETASEAVVEEIFSKFCVGK